MLAVRCASRSTAARRISNESASMMMLARRTPINRRMLSSSPKHTGVARLLPSGRLAAGGTVLTATTAVLLYSSTSNIASMEEYKRAADEKIGGSKILDDIQAYLGKLTGSSSQSEKEEEEEKGSESVESEEKEAVKESEVEEDTTHNEGGPGEKVVVPLDPELVESLPIMSLDEVRKCDGLQNKDRLLVTHDGIVYDVTMFAENHPGGRTLLETAAGLDLQHFFDNYTVHGKSDKAANWLAPLAVGKLTEEETLMAKQHTTPEKHVEKRMAMLTKARRKILVVTASLPLWLAVRNFVSFVGWFVPSLGRSLARIVPVVVPGFSPGAEPLHCEEEEQYSVAVIGGGIAGCGAAWSCKESGFRVTLFEARPHVSGNARTFDWDFSPYREKDEEQTVRSCVSVTAWPSLYYKNYTALLEKLDIETVHQPLSWFLNSKVEGAVGTLWGADPRLYEGSLRKVLEKDFNRYKYTLNISNVICDFFTFRWAPWRREDEPSMYDNHQGLGFMNPFNIIPLYTLFRSLGGSDLWWDVVFTPHYTASFLVDELRPFPAVFGPVIESQIPLLPNKSNCWQGKSKRGENDCNINTCVTWKDAGKGIREVFDRLTSGIDLRENTRVLDVKVLPNGKKRVYDENDKYVDVDRVIFACPVNAIGNIHKSHSELADTILATPIYADDLHPSSGHMHAVMHSDSSVIESEHREDCLKRASNYVEVTRLSNGEINIENQYNFGVQTPGPGVYDLPLDKKPVMLISHSLGEGKSIDPSLVRGTGNHARAHPLYSGWNLMAMLSLRLVNGENGIYYCSNWTTPANTHDMSFLSGLVCAHAVGAKYPFEHKREAKKDFNRLRDLMGI